MYKLQDWWVPDLTKINQKLLARNYFVNPATMDWQNFSKNISIDHKGGIRSFVNKYCKRKKVYVDIGSNVGFTTIPMSNMFRTVYSFEMCYANYRCLIKNCVPYDNITAINVGVSDSYKSVDCVMFPSNGMVNQIVGDDGGLVIDRHERSMIDKCPVAPLDGLILHPVDCIKIDVEGHEIHVLNGARGVLQMSNALVIVESIDTQSQVTSLMESMGYFYRGTLGKNDLVFSREAL